MEQLKQIVIASSKSSDGSVNAVFEVNIKLFVTVGFDKDEIGGLNEGDLRASLASQAGELISQISMEDAIDVGPIIELRDGGIQGETIEGVLESDAGAKTYAVIGRIPHDDEDTCCVFKAPSREKAMQLFADIMYEDAVGEDREHNIDAHGGDLGVFINHVLVSASEIQEAS